MHCLDFSKVRIFMHTLRLIILPAPSGLVKESLRDAMTPSALLSQLILEHRSPERSTHGRQTSPSSSRLPHAHGPVHARSPTSSSDASGRQGRVPVASAREGLGRIAYVWVLLVVVVLVLTVGVGVLLLLLVHLGKVLLGFGWESWIEVDEAEVGKRAGRRVSKDSTSG